MCFACSPGLTIASDAQNAGYNNAYPDKAVTVTLGLSGGVMNCLTDIGGKSAVLKTFKPEGGFYVGAMYQQIVGARLEIAWGSVTASDINSPKPGTRTRNLSFSSDISEISLIGELHPLHFSPNYNLPFSVYLLGGIGTFSFNPKTTFNNQEVLLQPLHTEGEGFAETGRPNYKLTQLMIPVGGGLSYQVSPLLTVKGELVYRLLNTDYLDDVSTTYIDPALFDRYLSKPDAALAKQLYDRSGERTQTSNTHIGSFRGNTVKDGYYSLNLKVEFTF